MTGEPDDWQRFHEECVVVDGHDDLMVDVLRRRLRGETNVLGRVHIPKLRRGGIDLVFMTCGGDHSVMFDGADQPGWSADALRAMDELEQEVAEAAGQAFIVRSRADLDAVTGDRIGIVMHFEGGRPLEGQLGMLRHFHRLGLRSLGLVWFLRNALADSCAERKPAGLSHFGAAVVAEAERLAMILDVAHLSEPGARDVLDLARGPVVATHANAYAVKAHPRNLSDELIRRIARSGGVVGLAAFPPFVSVRSPRPTLDDLLDHADHIARLVGTDHLGLGLDFIDFAPDSFLPYHAAIGTAIGLDLGRAGADYPEEIADSSMTPNLTRALFRRGYSKSDVANVLGGNFLRVLRQVLPAVGEPRRASAPGRSRTRAARGR